MSEAPQHHQPDDVLLQLLLRSKLVSPADLEAARKERRRTGDSIEAVLVREGLIDSKTLSEFLAKLEGMTKINLAGFELNAELVAMIPAEIAIAHEIVPIDRMGQTLTVGVTAPPDPDVIAKLETETDLRIKPILCSPQDIHAALQQYYGVRREAESSRARLLEAPLKLQMAVSMLRHIDQLPGLPGTVTRVREMLYTDEGSAAEAGEVISRDPAVAAKVLKVANSAAYGFPNRVDNVNLAVSLLGLIETYSVVVSTSVINLLDRSRSFDYMTFWLESMVCATMATAISRAVDTRLRSGVFSAGLLHDIGRVALAEVAPKHYARVNRSLTGLALIENEEDVIGLTHTEAGYQLAQRWGLPEEIAETIRFHHTPAYAQPEHRALVSMVNIADVVSRAHRPDTEHRLVDFAECRESMQFLEMNDDDVLEIFRGIPRADEKDSLWNPN